MNTFLRLAAGGALVSCIFALNSRDARGLDDPSIFQLQMSGQSTCGLNAAGNAVVLEAHGYDLNNRDVCEVATVVGSGSTVSTTCPFGVNTHKAWINERSNTDYSLINTYVQSPNAVFWPAFGTVTSTNGPITATIVGSGCGTARATSIAYNRP